MENSQTHNTKMKTNKQETQHRQLRRFMLRVYLRTS